MVGYGNNFPEGKQDLWKLIAFIKAKQPEWRPVKCKDSMRKETMYSTQEDDSPPLGLQPDPIYG